MKYLVILMVLSNLTLALSAQSNVDFNLQKSINIPGIGDSIIKQQVEYVDPGASGTNIAWYFQNVKPVNEFYTVNYTTPNADSSFIAGIEHGTVYYYQLRGDSIFHTGYENSTTYMQFNEAELRLKFPFSYKESIKSKFEGEGEYCHRIPLHVSGTTVVSVDATGTLIAPLGLKFENVLRVKTVREYEETGKDSLTMHLESYAWYVKGNRYPIFETIRTSTIKTKGDEFKHNVASFFYPPAEQATLLTDPGNWNNLNEPVEILSIDQLLSNCVLMPNPVQSQLKIEYDLVCDATISFKLCDNSGVVRIMTAPIARQAGHYTETLNMRDFVTGVYPLYVNVDNLVKILKVIKN